MTLLSRFTITKTLTAVTVAILALSLGAVALVISAQVSNRIASQAIASQNMNLRAAATLIERDLAGVTVSWTQDGNVARIVAESLPTVISDHRMIDAIGRMTGQTATLFGWDPASKDFWRRTTNIIKPDGSRAVGTALGQKGAVYAAVTKGEVYRGEAVILDVPYYTIYQPIFSPSGDVIGILYAGVRAAGINSLAGDMTRAIAVTALAALLVAAVLIALCVRGTIGILPRLTATAGRLAKGDLQTDVPGQTLKNEVGALARAIDVFRQSAIDKIEMERRARDAATASEEERRQREIAKAQETEQLEAAMDSLAGGLRRLSDGDLMVRLDTPFSGSFDRLRIDFNQSVEKLMTAMAAIRAETHGIEASSAEMRVATDHLAKRTEQQAASLEQTSASLEEITVTVRSSLAKADEAAGIAERAQASTQTSSQVVADAVGAMSRIEEASSEISKIINVIDEIAFQTNLLALNAGVEAARAGEAGKGFAVVAQEVRELAQRSANAAKDIKALIRKSGDAVANGVELVQRTGGALNEIAAQVSVINTHISGMTQATREQSSALGEINSSIGHMDQFTQKNAAMVEEANAVTHRLAESAQTLGGLVGEFKVIGGSVRAGGDTLSRPSRTAPPAPRLAAANARPVASPARGLISSLGKRLAGGGAAARTDAAAWEEF